MMYIVWGWYNASNLAYNPSDNTNTTYRSQAKGYGYFITDAEYVSFPETIESIFYGWRITGDQRWQDYQWQIFNNLKAEHNGSTPYASTSDVEQPGSLEDYLPRCVLEIFLCLSVSLPFFSFSLFSSFPSLLPLLPVLVTRFFVHFQYLHF